MAISAPFILRPVATTLLMIGVLLLGLVAYLQLGVAPVPNVEFPAVFITSSLPGASPETMATSVATPLERQLGTIAGISQMTSVNSTGSTVIIILFDLSRGIEGAARDVEAAINAAASNLPKDLPRAPVYFKANPNNQPIVTLAFTSDSLTPQRVYDYVNTIVVEKLSQIDGISQVAISGAEAPAIRVQLDPAALASMNLSLEQVRTAIQNATHDSPKGSLDGRALSWTIALDDQLKTAAALSPIIVAWRNNAPIRLGEIASVTDSIANTRVAGWLNTQEAVMVGVRKRAEANMVATIDRVRAELPLLRHWLPPGIRIDVVGDRSLSVRHTIRDVELTLLLTAFLVIAVIAVFLRRFWATVIPSVTIPVSLAATFGVMYAFGYTLDNLSLMALLVSIGFVVDDAIVMIENIVRLIESGLRPLDAALRGAGQMGFTVVSITASLVSALVPLVFLTGIAGRFFREFSVTLTSSILVSALVSLTLTPMLCGQLLGRDRVATVGGRPGAGAVPARGLIDRTADLYAVSLRRVLRHRRVMLALTLLIVVLTFWLYGYVPKTFMPAQDIGVIRGATDAPPDISFAAMRERQMAVVETILRDPAVANVTSNVGGSGAGPFGASAVNTGSLTVNLKPIDERGIGVKAVIDRLRPEMAKVPGIDTFLVPVQDFGRGNDAGKGQYEYTLSGPVELNVLQHWVQTMSDAIATHPEFKDVTTDQDSNGRQLSLVIDRASAARLGVTPTAIDQTLYDAFGQRQVATWYGTLDQYKVVLEVAAKDRATPEALGRLYLPGGQIPLSAVVRQVEDFAPVSLNHEGQLPAITITYNLAPGVSLGDAQTIIAQVQAAVNLPPEIIGSDQGDALDFKESNSAMPYLLAGAVIGMYIVLGMLYESFVHPLTILSTIPSAGLGALLALLATHTELSIIAVVGIILLIGIVKKNAILMVDFALVAERDLGLSPLDAIQRAARLRFRPITMTTLAAVLGALPMAVGMGAGSEMRQPLGITMIGGLLVSQVVTLYTTPVVYLALDYWRRARRPKVRLAGAVPAE